LPILDLDVAIEAAAGEPLKTWINKAGWAAFRVLELETFAQLLRSPEFIIACGAGLIETPAARDLIRDATDVVLWLDLPPEAQPERLRETERPRVHPEASLAAELEQVDGRRRPLYAELAGQRIDAHAPVSKVLRDCLTVLETSCAPS
jgi:shikimate kinase